MVTIYSLVKEAKSERIWHPMFYDVIIVETNKDKEKRDYYAGQITGVTTLISGLATFSCSYVLGDSSLEMSVVAGTAASAVTGVVTQGYEYFRNKLLTWSLNELKRKKIASRELRNINWYEVSEESLCLYLRCNGIYEVDVRKEKQEVSESRFLLEDEVKTYLTPNKTIYFSLGLKDYSKN